MSGGTSQEKTTLPKFYETGLQQGVGMGRDISAMGYTPYYGPDVAAMSPMETAGIQGTQQAASAFGMPTGEGQYMPEPTTFAGGVQGYSSQPIFQESVDRFAADRPAQSAYYDSFFVDPYTGQMGSRTAQNQPVALEMTAAQKRGK